MHRKFPQVSCCSCFLLLSIDLHRLSKNHCADAGVGCVHTPRRVGDADPVHRGRVGMSPVPYTATGRIPYGKYTVTCRTVSHPLIPFLFAHRYSTGASTAIVRPVVFTRKVKSKHCNYFPFSVPGSHEYKGCLTITFLKW